MAVVSAGHPIAADVAWDVLAQGGNMVDAGIAAVLALSVVHSEQVQLGGILPALVRPAGTKDVFAVEGVGRWPEATDVNRIHTNHRGRLPRGILRTTTPALPDACLTALDQFGTMSFSDLAKPARDLAANGFEAHLDLVATTTAFERRYREYPENTDLWFPNDKLLAVGDTFQQPKLAKTLDRMIKAGLDGGHEAVRQIFYHGDIAKQMVAHVAAHDGWLSADDLAVHTTPVSTAVSGQAFGADIHTPGPWTQGPCITQCLKIAQALGLTGPPDAEWWHTLLEAMKLGFADRDRFFGDPDFTNVPLGRLLSDSYAGELAALVGPGVGDRATRQQDGANEARDTSVVAVADGQGGVFVATPSDMSHDAPAVPDLGFVMSTRGGQSHVSADHPASIAPRKRPRVSASPFLVAFDDGRFIAGGGPGGDLAIQSHIAVLTQHLGAGTDLARAIAAPRTYTLDPPGSSTPHLCFPGKLNVESALTDGVFNGLLNRGHQAVRQDAKSTMLPSVCAVEVDPTIQTARAIGDPRRLSGQRGGTER